MRLQPVHLLIHPRQLLFQFTHFLVDLVCVVLEEFLGSWEGETVERVADFVAVGSK